MRLWKTGIVCWKVLTQLRVECEAKRPMLHNENIRCHGNTCFTRLIILKYFVSNLCPHVHKRLNFEINRTTIENFLKKIFRKKKLNFFDVTSPKKAYVARQIWGHITFRPSYKEHFATSLTSLRWLVQKLSPVMYFTCFWWPWPWSQVNFDQIYAVPCQTLIWSRYVKRSLTGSKLLSLEGEERDEEKRPMLHNGIFVAMETHVTLNR